MSEIKIFKFILEYILFHFIISIVSSISFIIYYNYILLFNFVKSQFFLLLFFSLELRLPITTNLVYVLKNYYSLEKSLPVAVWVKDKPFLFFWREIFYYYICHIKTKNNIFKNIYIFKKTLNELTLKTEFSKNKTN